MQSFDLKDLPTKEAHAFLLGSVGPRPIALASTISNDGVPNLSPFSYFNVFSTQPPTLIFSPARRVRNNTTKDTLEFADQTREVVINIVSYDIVQQTSLASTEYETGVNEFVKAGLTPIESDHVKPFRVKESPVQFECKVTDIVALGTEGGAGNLVICEVVRMHVNEKVLDSNGKIDQQKIDLVGRMGGNYYCRASGSALFEVEKPLSTKGIGVDNIPKRIVESPFLDGNDLGILGNVEKLPNQDEIREYVKTSEVRSIFSHWGDSLEAREELHQFAKELLNQGRVMEAWKTLLSDQLKRD